VAVIRDLYVCVFVVDNYSEVIKTKFFFCMCHSGCKRDVCRSNNRRNLSSLWPAVGCVTAFELIVNRWACSHFDQAGDMISPERRVTVLFSLTMSCLSQIYSKLMGTKFGHELRHVFSICVCACASMMSVSMSVCRLCSALPPPKLLGLYVLCEEKMSLAGAWKRLRWSLDCGQGQELTGVIFATITVLPEQVLALVLFTCGRMSIRCTMSRMHWKDSFATWMTLC